MKTDAEVLAGAIEILEKEGVWCKGAYYMTDGLSTKRVFFCAEGAIREVAGYWELVSDVPTDEEDLALNLVALQCKKLERLVLQQADWQPTPMGCLNGFNDDEHTTVADVLLAMKKALNEVENDPA